MKPIKNVIGNYYYCFVFCFWTFILIAHCDVPGKSETFTCSTTWLADLGKHTHTHKHQSELTFSRFVRFWIRIDLHKLKRKIRQAYTFFSSFNDMAAVALFCSYRYFAIIIVVAARAITAITAITTSATAVAVAAAVFNKTGILCMGFLILINFNIHIMKWNGSRAVESEWWTNETGKRMNEKRSFVMLRCSHCFLLLFLPPLLLLLLVLVSVFLILSSFFFVIKETCIHSPIWLWFVNFLPCFTVSFVGWLGWCCLRFLMLYLSQRTYYYVCVCAGLHVVHGYMLTLHWAIPTASLEL